MFCKSGIRKLNKKKVSIQKYFKEKAINMTKLQHVNLSSFPFKYILTVCVNIKGKHNDSNTSNMQIELVKENDEKVKQFILSLSCMANLFSSANFLEWKGKTHHKYRYELFDTSFHYKIIKNELRDYRRVNNGKINRFLV